MNAIKNVILTFIVLVFLIDAGYSSESDASLVPGDNTKLNNRTLTDTQWLSDLDSLVHFMVTTHPNPFWRTSREDFDKQIAMVRDRIPHLSDSQVIVEFMRITAMVKDGHTQLLGDKLAGKWYPVRIELFSDGWFITSISKKYSEAYGAKVLKVGDINVEDVMNKIVEIVPADNEWGAKYFAPKYFMMSSVAQALGYADTNGLLEMEIAQKDGNIKILKIIAEPYKSENAFYDMVAYWFWRKNAVPAADYINIMKRSPETLPLLFQNYEKPYWFTYLPSYKTVYFGFNECQQDSNEKFDAFCERLWKLVEGENPDKLIIDLRNNIGGTTDILRPLLHGIIRHKNLNKRGHLFVMIGRKTFSAALQCAVWLENESDPIFAGEPTAAAPNHNADAKFMTLPNSGINLMVSHLYWQKSKPDDARRWIEPQIRVPALSTDYFNCADPAIQAVLLFK